MELFSEHKSKKSATEMLNILECKTNVKIKDYNINT